MVASSLRGGAKGEARFFGHYGLANQSVRLSRTCGFPMSYSCSHTLEVTMGQVAEPKTTGQVIKEQREALIRRRELAHNVEPGTYAGFDWLRKVIPELPVRVRR